MEKVLAINSKINFNGFIKHDSLEGIRVISLLKNTYEVFRPECETDYNFKQLVCYGFITYKDQIFMVKRLNKQSEQRLHNLYSIGIGGHANPIDNNVFPTLQTNMLREINEEINIKNYYLRLHGFINDDLNDVGKVHLGIVYEIQCFDSDITIKETDKMEGKFIPINELYKYYNEMETWSQILSKNL